MATLIPHVNFTSITSPPSPSLKKTRNLKTPQKSNLQDSVSSFTKQLTSTSKCLDEAYSVILDHCAKQNALQLGKQIHTHVAKRHCASDLVFLNTKLVFMYGKCGNLLGAEQVFGEMPERSIFSYNAILGAYVSDGDYFKAVELYAGMRCLDVFVDAHTCSSVVKACGGMKDLSVGREVHGLAIKYGLSGNGVVMNSLVSMYARCDDLDSVGVLFGRVSGEGDVVFWNSMISAYAANGMKNEALRMFGAMQSLGVAPSTYTFVAVLQACELLQVGMQIHAFIVKYGDCLDRYVANALVVMYSKCYRINEASRVFAYMDDQDNISINSMLTAYIQNGMYDESLNYFKKMISSGHQLDHVSVISVLSACGRSGNLLKGIEVHAFALKNGMYLDLQVGNTIIDMYAKCSKPNCMEAAFQRLLKRDHISWTTVIAGYVQNNCYMKALQTFKELQMEGTDIDQLMIESVLLACRGLKCISMAREIHGHILRKELSDIVLLNTFIGVYGDCGKVDYARNTFGLIEDKNVVSWTSMINCYGQNGLANEALKLSFDMIQSDVELDFIALLGALSAVTKLSALRKGKEIHGYILRKCMHFEELVASSLVDMYAGCGAVDESYRVFNSVRGKDLILWTSMINAYGMHGHGTEAIKLFKMMEAEGLRPDHVTFLALLYACSHSSLVDEGKTIFGEMQHEYNLEPWPEHYVCLVDLLGRANYLDEAFELVKSMKTDPTAAVWCALLGACRTHSNMIIGEIAARELLAVDPENPGTYVLVSNLYAAAERWDYVEDIRVRMKAKGLKKDPACSWIIIGNCVHTFISRDRSHPQSEAIYDKLSQITEELESVGGYKPQTRYVLHNLEEKEKVKMLRGHSERLAIAYGLLNTPINTPIRVTKNLRVCGDCHNFTKLVSKFSEREIIVRDANRFHHFSGGVCSCGDFW